MEGGERKMDLVRLPRCACIWLSNFAQPLKLQVERLLQKGPPVCQDNSSHAKRLCGGFWQLLRILLAILHAACCFLSMLHCLLSVCVQ